MGGGYQVTDIQHVKLSGIATFAYGYTDTAKDSGNYRFIRITDIDENGKLTSASPKYISGSKTELEKYILKKNDLLMARTGATYGKTMLFQSEEPSVYASFLIRIRFKEAIFTGTRQTNWLEGVLSLNSMPILYLRFWFQSPLFQSRKGLLKSLIGLIVW